MNKTPILICLLLMGNLFADNWIDDGNGGVYWTMNNYTISAYPKTSNELINHYQYVNFTSTNPANILTNLSFVFDQQPLSGDVLLWQNLSHQVQVPHTTRLSSTYQFNGVTKYEVSTSPCQTGDAQNTLKYSITYGNNSTTTIACFDSYTNISNNYTITYSYNGTTYTTETRYWMDWGTILNDFTYTTISNHHVYTINNVPFNGNTNYQTKFLYSLPIKKTNEGFSSSGKFDIYAHSGSPSDVVNGIGTTYVVLDPWWNSTWNYKQQINFTNWNCGFTYCQFPINFSSSKTNGTDIRILNATEDGELSFYRESGNWSAATGTGNLWVNASNNTASIWIYYNTTGTVSDASNGDAVFSFFDDFNNGTSMTAGKWDHTPAELTIANSIMNFKNAGADHDIVKSINTFPTTGQSAVFRVSIPPTTGYYCGIGWQDSNVDTNITAIWLTASVETDVNGAFGTALGTLPYLKGWQSIRVMSNPLNASFYLPYNQLNTTKVTTPKATNIGFSSWTNVHNSTVTLDWIGVANMGELFPTLTFSNEQSSIVPNSPNTNLTVYIQTSTSQYNGTWINYTVTGIFINPTNTSQTINASITGNGTNITSETNITIAANAAYILTGNYTRLRPMLDANFTINASATGYDISILNGTSSTVLTMILPIDPPSAINLMANGGKDRCRTPQDVGYWDNRNWNINASWNCNYTGLSLTNNISFVDSGTTTFSNSSITASTFSRLAGDLGTMANFIFQAISTLRIQ
jgi:hypothetical protein